MDNYKLLLYYFLNCHNLYHGTFGLLPVFSTLFYQCSFFGHAHCTDKKDKSAAVKKIVLHN